MNSSASVSWFGSSSSDGLRDVRLYGVPGQKQEGIDLYGLRDGGAAVVF